MKKFLTFSAFALGTALAPQPIPAQNRQPLARSLPATSHVVIEFAGLAGCRDSWREHGLAKLVQRSFDRLEPAVQKRLTGPWREQARPRAWQWLDRVDLSPATLRALLQGPAALLMGRPTVASGMLVPSVALVFDLTGHETSGKRVVARLAALVGENRSKEQVIEGVATRVLQVGNPAIDRAYVAISQGKLVVSNSRGFFEECLRATRGRDQSLADHDAYRAGRKHLRGRKLASVWIDTEPWMAAVRPFLPYEADAIATALGLGELRGVFLAAGTDGTLGTEVAHFGWRGDVNGLFRAPIAKPASIDAAKLCSPDTVAFAAARIDPTALHAGLRRIFDALPDWMRAAATEHGERHLEAADRIGEHLAILTGDFAIACNAPRVLPIPEITLFAGVRDEAKVTELLIHLMKQARGDSFRTQKFLDTDIHSVVVEIEQVGLAPCFACKDGTLMISTHPRILKATLRRAQNNGPSLGETTGFENMVKRVRGAAAFAYVATGELAKRALGFPQVQAFLRAGLTEAGIDPKLLPDTEDLAAALEAIVVSARVDRDGFTVTCHSPLGEGSMLAFAGYLLDLLLRDLIGRDI